MKSKTDSKEQKPEICALILCAGSGTRAGLPYNKLLHYIGKQTVLELTIDRFRASRITSVMLAVSPTDEEQIRSIAGKFENISVCIGGATRFESVRKGLEAIGKCDIVCIHDGARPYVNPDTINKSIESAQQYGSGIVAVPTVDTIKVIENNKIVKNLARAGLYNIQTPQTFEYEKIRDAYGKASTDMFTDDSEVFASAGYSPRIVIGEYENIKVTHPHDLFAPAMGRTRIGVGFDVHRLVSGRPLIIGGVRIPFKKGLKGHSDADVLTHAIMDALLSAGGFPDIGVLFPDTDKKFKDISSLILLAQVVELITRHGYTIGNISAVIMAEKPKMQPYMQLICDSLAQNMNISPAHVNVSATTTEQLGIIGNEQGIAASATCMLFK